MKGHFRAPEMARSRPLKRVCGTAFRGPDFTIGQLILPDIAKLWRTRLKLRFCRNSRVKTAPGRACATLVGMILINRLLPEKTPC